MPNPDAALIRRLGMDFVDQLRRLLGEAQSCALLDFPNHANSGDSAIWVGERRALSLVGCRVSYMADRRTYTTGEMKRCSPDGPVLLHGGGNMGDLWPDHARHREKVIAHLQGRHVIQLPQTVSERSEAHLRTLDTLGEQLSRFDVLVRDSESLERLEPYVNLRGLLCPDAAFAMGPLALPGTPEFDVVWIRRADHEAAHTYPASVDEDLKTRVVDWFSNDAPIWRRARASAAVRTRNTLFAEVPRFIGARWTTQLSRLFDPMAARRVRHAVRILADGKVVITDRLHGHILCELLGIPHVLLDTAEAKVGSFHQTFTSSSRLAQTAGSSEEALEIARELIAGCSRA